MNNKDKLTYEECRDFVEMAKTTAAELIENEQFRSEYLVDNKSFIRFADVIIEALEYREPKKSNITEDGKHYCPACETLTSRRRVMSWEKYCPDCGQAID